MSQSVFSYPNDYFLVKMRLSQKFMKNKYTRFLSKIFFRPKACAFVNKWKYLQKDCRRLTFGELMILCAVLVKALIFFARNRNDTPEMCHFIFTLWDLYRSKIKKNCFCWDLKTARSLIVEPVSYAKDLFLFKSLWDTNVPRDFELYCTQSLIFYDYSSV